MARTRTTFGSDFRKFFLRGLAVLLPSVLTLWLLWAAYGFVSARVAEPINGGIRLVILEFAPRVVQENRLPEWFVVTPDQIDTAREQRRFQGLRPIGVDALRKQIRANAFRDWWNDHWYLQIIGLVVAILLIYLAGTVAGGFIGRRVYVRFERWLTRIPVFKQVYPHVKQVVDFLLGNSRQLSFNRVVVVEYPRKGIFTVGFQTGSTMRAIQDVTGVECCTVFIPSSPTPFTGYTITVPASEVQDLPITVEEALRFVVTGGVLIPEHQTIPGSPQEAPALASGGREAMMIDPGSPGGLPNPGARARKERE